MFKHGKRGVEKLREDHEIDGNIIFSCRVYFLSGMLIEKEEVSLMKRDALPVDDMHSFSLTHINEFNIVVGVERKVHEAHVWTHIYELTVLKNS